MVENCYEANQSSEDKEEVSSQTSNPKVVIVLLFLIQALLLTWKDLLLHLHALSPERSHEPLVLSYMASLPISPLLQYSLAFHHPPRRMVRFNGDGRVGTNLQETNPSFCAG